MNETEIECHDSDGEFAFETDHIALRGSKDYCEVLKYIVKLEAQKIDTLQSIEKIASAHKKALADPMAFIMNLKSDKISFPTRHVVPELPNIDWKQYNIDLSFDNELKVIKNELENSLKVRGRKFTDNKPETFNQLWSCEEQKRLEELLLIYPEEEIEAKRYQKIARDLGTRTPLQVMSRVQKYFAKLAKAGLPIPGRTPKRKFRDNKKTILYKKSTFFPQLHVPVKMDDLYESSNEAHEGPSTVEMSNSNMNMLDLLRAAKEQRVLDETSPVYQNNTMCVGCQKSGFLGARWTDNAGTDYCTDCVVRLLPSEKLIPVRQPK